MAKGIGAFRFHMPLCRRVDIELNLDSNHHRHHKSAKRSRAPSAARHGRSSGWKLLHRFHAATIKTYHQTETMTIRAKKRRCARFLAKKNRWHLELSQKTLPMPFVLRPISQAPKHFIICPSVPPFAALPLQAVVPPHMSRTGAAPVSEPRSHRGASERTGQPLQLK